MRTTREDLIRRGVLKEVEEIPPIKEVDTTEQPVAPQVGPEDTAAVSEGAKQPQASPNLNTASKETTGHVSTTSDAAETQRKSLVMSLAP